MAGQIAPGAVVGVEFEGLPELTRAFAALGVVAQREFRGALREIAEPVARRAESLALSKIRRIEANAKNVHWSRMRIGITAHMVYVAPKERGRYTKRNPQRYKRPNLALLLMGKAMEPALLENEPAIKVAVDGLLDTLGRAWAEAA